MKIEISSINGFMLWRELHTNFFMIARVITWRHKVIHFRACAKMKGNNNFFLAKSAQKCFVQPFCLLASRNLQRRLLLALALLLAWLIAVTGAGRLGRILHNLRSLLFLHTSGLLRLLRLCERTCGIASWTNWMSTLESSFSRSNYSIFLKSVHSLEERNEFDPHWTQ